MKIKILRLGSAAREVDIPEVTQPLRSLLEFDSQQHGLPITYHHESIVRFRSDDPFRRAIDIWVHTHGDTREITFPIAGEEIAIEAAVCLGKFDNPVGPVSDVGVPLRYIQGRAILVPFDLEDLESDVPNAVNKLWAAISELAVSQVADHIRAYAYEDEKKRYSLVKAHALARWADKVRRDLDDNRYDIDQKTREISELVTKIEEQRAALEHFEHCKPGLAAAEAVREYAGLMMLTPKPYRSIDFDETRLPKQNCSSASTDMDQAEVAKILVDLEARGIDPRTLRLWLHSHAEMGCFWSTTDAQTIAGLCNDGFVLSIVTNKKGQMLARVDIFEPIRFTVDKVAVEPLFPEFNLRDACKAEIDAKVGREILPAVQFAGTRRGDDAQRYPDLWDETFGTGRDADRPRPMFLDDDVAFTADRLELEELLRSGEISEAEYRKYLTGMVRP